MARDLHGADAECAFGIESRTRERSPGSFPLRCARNVGTGGLYPAKAGGIAPHVMGDPTKRDQLGLRPAQGTLELDQVACRTVAPDAVIFDSPGGEHPLQQGAEGLLGLDRNTVGERAAVYRQGFFTL